MEYLFSKNSPIEVSRERLFSWHTRPEAFLRLCPPWVHLGDVTRSGGVEDGASVNFTQYLFKIPFKWEIEHFGYRQDEQFCDRARKSPFKSYTHVHRFLSYDKGTVLQDSVSYNIPSFLHCFAAREFNRLFSYRHQITQGDALHHERMGWQPRRILIAGSSGLIGSQLVPFLRAAGHTVELLERKKGARHFWDPESGILPTDALEGFDAIVNLCGHSITQRLWTEKEKEKIAKSRLTSTHLLVKTIRQLKKPPQVFASASAVGVYGSRGDSTISEQDESGSGFLAELCRQWEALALEVGVCRAVVMRFGVVLSARGGVLEKMVPATRLGLGTTFGSADHWMSWIDINDAVRAIDFLLCKNEAHGPVHLVAPHPVTNRNFMQKLASIMKRPLFLNVPARVLRLLPGGFADEALLASQKTFPDTLLRLGFSFQHPSLEDALGFELGVFDML